jgi:hypothetical protein
VRRTNAFIRAPGPSGDSATKGSSSEITCRRYCAWLTLDMKKSGISSDGMAARVA